MMRPYKQLFVLVLLLTSHFVFTQENNVLLDRSYWKGSPDLSDVKAKIEAGNDATVFNSNAFDALTYAILEKTDLSVVSYLLTLPGNSIDKKTHDSRIYLHWAAYSGQPEVVEYLLEKGSSVSALDSHGNTPLTFAANAGQKDPALYEAFEKHGVPLADHTNENGANVLLLVAPAISNEAELDYFTSKGLPLESVDEDGNGIFQYAARGGNITFLKTLIDRGVSYKEPGDTGANAFLFAARGARGFENPIPVFDYLESLGLEPNRATKDGYTALHYLSYRSKDPKIFNYFLTRGADVNQKDAEGNTPFLNAASRNGLVIVELLSEDVGDYSLQNKEGQTALMRAVERNEPEVVAFLLEKQSDSSTSQIGLKDVHGNTLAYYLLTSFDSRSPEVFDAKMDLLAKDGVELNQVQANGNTLYHLAAKENELALLKRLTHFDIPVNTQNNDGLTALHIAAMRAKDDEMMKYLIQMGADTNIRTAFEESVYDLASENELLQKGSVSLEFLN